MELKDQILAELTSLKADLQASLEAKATTNIEAKLKEFKSAIDAQIEELKKADKTADELKAMKAEMDAVKAEAKAVTDAFDAFQLKYKNQTPADAPKTFSTAIKEAFDEKHDDIQKFMRKEVKKLDIELKAVADESTANVTGGTVYGAQYKPGIIMNPNQIGHVRSFIPVVNAGPGTDYYFMRENGAGEGAPAPTSEKQATAATTQATGLKPQFDIDLIESSVKFETIAGFMLASRKSLSNIKSFLSFLQARIPEKLWDVEDSQVLYGNGTSPELDGILNTGNFIAGDTTGATLIARILNDLAGLEDTYKRTANAIVLRPIDYWSLFQNVASGSGEYDLPQNVVFVNGVLYIGGIPVTKSTALTSGDYLIGSAMGAEILQQEAMRLEFFEQDGTNVRTNQVTIRVEETIALPVYAATHFVKGTVPA